MFRNSRSVWKVRAIPSCVILCGGSPAMLSPLEQDLARVRPVDAGDEVEDRRLAGAVRADHADDLALVDVQVEPVDDAQAAERLRHAPELEQRASRPSDDLHARRAEQALRAHVIRTTSSAPKRIQRATAGCSTKLVSQTIAAR